MNINFEKVKELFAKIKFEKGKGAATNITKVIALLTLTGTLLSKNPVQNNNGNTIVYAKETLDDVKDESANFSLDTANEEKVELTLEETKKNAVKDLKSVYKTYLKKYYTSKTYKKLTSKYKKGVNVINACKTNEKVEEYYGRYEAALKAIKPSKLVSYQKKLETSFLKTYKKLIENNEYSDNNLAKLEDIKNEGIESIYGALTKTKSKKAKTNYVKELSSVKTLIVETKDYVISYINNNKELSEEEKTTLINQVNNSDDIEDINSIKEEYGYEEVVDEKTITVEQINQKIDKLVKEYPKYTEEEIRCMVAAANMDDVKDEDILTIFGANSKKDMEDKVETIRVTLIHIRLAMEEEIFKPPGDEETYLNVTIKYPNILKTYDLFINEDMYKHAEIMWNNTAKKIAAKKGYARGEYGLDEYSFEDAMQNYHFVRYICNASVDSKIDGGIYYGSTDTIPVNDERLAGVGGFIINSIHLESFSINNYIYKNYLTKNYPTLDAAIEDVMKKYDNCIMNRINKIKKLK